MIKKLTFIPGKEYGTSTGSIITMKALITMRGEQYVECNENDLRYKASELTEVIEPGITEIK